jgi:hypothetical protein
LHVTAASRCSIWHAALLQPLSVASPTPPVLHPQAGGAGDELAVALIENSSRCPTNEEGEKVVPGEVPWIVDLVEKVGGVVWGSSLVVPLTAWAA